MTLNLTVSLPVCLSILNICFIILLHNLCLYFVLDRLFLLNLPIRGIAAAFRVEAGRKSVAPNLSKSLTERNHLLDYLFSTRDIVMKERTKGNKDTSEGDEDESIDNAGYRDLPTVGVSHPTHPFHKEYMICV